MRGKYIPTLDGWRAIAIAIAGVLLCHSFPSTYWTMNGALGVNLFFAISGYLITTRLLSEPISLRAFYLRRAFRILPPAFLYLAVVGIVAALGFIEASRTDIFSCLAFARNYWGSDPDHGWYTGHFWSLSVEEQFYLFWPALLVLAGIRRARWLAPALAIAFAVWRSLDLRHGWIADFFHNEMLRNHSLRSDYRMDSLLWGCTLALLPRTRALERIPGWLPLAAAIALNIAQPRGYLIGEAILFPLVLIRPIHQPHSPLSRLLESKPLRSLGRLSYSLYIWQQLFFSQYHHGVLQRFPLNLGLALACAWLSYRYVEKPAINLGRRLMESTPLTPIPEHARAHAAGAPI